jgi:hypothetical protein
VGAMLSMAAGYICARLCDVSSGFLKGAVPHRQCIAGITAQWGAAPPALRLGNAGVLRHRVLIKKYVDSRENIVDIVYLRAEYREQPGMSWLPA